MRYFMRIVNRVFAFVLIVSFGLLFVSCGSRYSDVLDGTWYEQSEDGGLIMFSGPEMTYRKNDDEQTCKYTAESDGKTILIVPEDESFIFEEITYYYDDYSLLCHTRAGDKTAGYSSVIFARGVYIAPEPVQGELIDNTDADAPKEISDYSVKTVSFYVNSVHDAQESEEDEEDNEPEELLSYGKYEYSLTVQEDGTGLLSSMICPDVAVSSEWLEELSSAFHDLNIAVLNGYDKRIYMLSDDYPDYTLDIEFVSGELFHSSANGNYVTDTWLTIQKTLLDIFYEAVINGGYDPDTGEYHTTQPIKRIGMSDSDADSFGISTQEKRIEKNGKAYDYSNYVDYLVFAGGDSEHSSLMQSLKEINELIRTSSENDLNSHFETMEKIPAQDRDDDEDIVCYGFYQIDKLHSDPIIFWFRLSSGQSSSINSDSSVQNSFSYLRYCFDSRTGERISPNKLFINSDWFEADIITRLLDIYKDGPVKETIDSAEFRSRLHEMLVDPQTYGYIEWEPGYHFFTIYLPDDLIPELGYRTELQYYYDEYQDQLSEYYTSVW